MKVVLKNVNGESITIDVKPEDTFHDLKTKIHNESGIQLDLEQLNFKGKKITDDQIVAEYFFDDINIGEETGVKEDTSTVRPLQCAAPGCSNVGASCPNKVFFNFPASEDRCRHWLLVCRRLDLWDKPHAIVSQQYFVCSDHFIDSQFVDDSKQRLSRGAVPTVFDFNNQNAVPVEIIDGDEIVVEENCEVVVKQEGEKRLVESDCKSDIEEVDEELVLEHSGQLCRLCASAVSEAVYIFGTTGKEQHIAEKINTCLPVTGRAVYEEFILDCLTLKMQALQSFKMSGTTHPATWCHIPEDLNPQQHCCENLKYRIVTSCYRSRVVYNMEDSKANVAIIVMKPESELENASKCQLKTIENSFINGSVTFCTATKQGPSINGIQEPVCIEDICRGKSAYFCPLCCDGSMSVQNDAPDSSVNYNLSLLKEIGAKIYKESNLQLSEEFLTGNGIAVQSYLPDAGNDDSSNTWSEDQALENVNLESIPEEDNKIAGENKVHNMGDGTVILLNPKMKFPSCRLCGETFENIELCLDHAKCHMESDLYPCSLCELCFTNEMCLLSHCEEHKAEEERFLRPKGSKRLVCPTCGRRFNNSRTLAAHNCVSGTRPFKCSECGKFFRTEARLEFHQQVHEGGSPVVCEHCGKEFSRENNLFDHVRLVHMGEKSHHCEQCGKSFQLKARLIAHQRVHTGERPFVCDVCGGKFYDNATLKGHRVTHMDVKPFQCDKCGRCFARKTLFKQHILAHVDECKQPKVYNCKLCTDVAFPTYAKLVEHRKDSHPLVKAFEDDVTPHNTKPFKCDDCGKSFAYRVTLIAHRRNHTGELPFACEFCEKRFSQKRSLVLHHRTHTGEKPFSCNICGKRFVQSAHLYSHLRLHTGEKPYQCEVCGDRFRLKDVRDSHLRKHTGERPFKCNVCGKAFRTSHSYYQHMWIHQGKKPYPCEYCGKAFRRSNGLKIHIRIHTGEKPHACDICGRCFAQKQDMKKHRNLHLVGKL